MRAIWHEATLAEADKEDLVYVEGSWYFPPESLTGGRFQDSDKHTTCHWKGEANYYHVSVDDQINPDAAWYYPELKEGAVKRVGKDFSGYVAFHPSIVVTE